MTSYLSSLFTETNTKIEKDSFTAVLLQLVGWLALPLGHQTIRSRASPSGTTRRVRLHGHLAPGELENPALQRYAVTGRLCHGLLNNWKNV